MKRMATFLLLLNLILFAGLAVAQEPAGIPADVSEWFVDAASLAAVIVALTAFVRKHLWRGLDGLAVVAFDVALGAALGLLGQVLGYLEDGLVAALLFGAAAGVAAAGGVDGLRAILGGAKASENSTTRTDAARLRLRR